MQRAAFAMVSQGELNALSPESAPESELNALLPESGIAARNPCGILNPPTECTGPHPVADLPELSLDQLTGDAHFVDSGYNIPSTPGPDELKP